MCVINKYRLLVLLVITTFSTKAADVTTSGSKFRILAPEFICPKDENAVVEKPDNTVITLQTAADADLRIEWTVRWSLLTPPPAQRFTLMLWRTVRNLEKQLNKPPPEPYVYVIENSELLTGVDYIFNISSIESNEENSEPRSFHIDNTQGNQKLMIEGRNDMLSVLLVGHQTAYVDATFVVEAEITTCTPTQDYYFAWKIQSSGSNDKTDLPQIQGSRLEVPPCTLKAGFVYVLNCQVMRFNTGDLITQTSLPISVQKRGVEVYLSVDYLVVASHQPFSVESIVVNHDSCESSIKYEWQCSFNGESCYSSLEMENGTIYLTSGLADLGVYYVSLVVTVSNEANVANVTIKVVDSILPEIQLPPISRIVNEGSLVSLVANATNLAPTCTLGWYFATDEYLSSLNSMTSNDTCDDCEHGEALSETVTIYSLEEQFLSELADFSNETEWRQVSVSLPAATGRARFVVTCGCSLTFNCDAQGSVHADVWLQLNEGPKMENILISPESGTALETVFRLSTRAAVDEDLPLQYFFFCSLRSDTIPLASYIDHRAVETTLPFDDKGVDVFVKVCDVRGACSKSNPLTLNLASGEERSVDAMIQDARGHARRCEMIQLTRVVQSAILSYDGAGQLEAAAKFRQSLEESLKLMDKNHCILQNDSQFSELLSWLTKHDVDTSNLGIN